MKLKSIYRLNHQQLKQNDTFLKPLMTGIDEYGLNIKISHSDVGFLRSEIHNHTNSGNRYGAKKAGYLARLNKTVASDRFKQVINDHYTINRISNGNGTKYHAFNILIANENATADMVQSKGHGYLTYTDSHGRNVYQSLLDARRLLTTKLNKQRNHTIKSVVGAKFNDYGLFSDMESVTTTLANGGAILNAHMHMMLLIDTDVDVAVFKSKLIKLLAKCGKLYINIEPITTDYPRLEHRAVIDTSKPLTAQNKAISAIESVIKYNRKQVGFNDYNRPIKDNHGNIREFTQQMALADLTDYDRAVNSVAMVNTFYGIRMHENSGMFKASYADDLHRKAQRLATTLVIVYTIPTNDHIELNIDHAETHLFNLMRFKPPP